MPEFRVFYKEEHRRISICVAMKNKSIATMRWMERQKEAIRLLLFVTMTSPGQLLYPGNTGIVRARRQICRGCNRRPRISQRFPKRRNYSGAWNFSTNWTLSDVLSGKVSDVTATTAKCPTSTRHQNRRWENRFLTLTSWRKEATMRWPEQPISPTIVGDSVFPIFVVNCRLNATDNVRNARVRVVGKMRNIQEWRVL